MREVEMPWSVETVVAQRLEFCRLAVAEELGVSFVELCRRYGIKPKTGYKWVARYRLEGAAGLVDRSRRPRWSPAQTAPEMEQLVCEVRREHRTWGGRKIRGVLERRGYRGVPAPSTITDILRRNDLLDQPQSQAGGFTSFEAEAPNDLWQMDFKGWIETGTGRCDPFDILDDHSRFNLILHASADQQETTVRHLLWEVFETYGLPKRVLCDNGTPWGNNQPGYRWTSLGVWLVDLGVGMVHSRPGHPQTLGKDERFHRTLGLEVISTRPSWDSHQQLQSAFDRWRPIYNHQRPHDSLNGAVPADRYQPSARSMPTRIEPVDYPPGYQTRKVDAAARISYQGTLYKIGKAFTGQTVGIIPTTQDGILQIVYRHQPIRTINLTQ